MKLSKSKLALAKVINENGGWHDNDTWLFSTQSGDGVLKFWKAKPKAQKGSVCTEWSGGCRLNFALSRVIQSWHQTILSREEYHQAYPKADADGWIAWKGDMKSPVESGVPVDVKTKDGNEHYDQLLGDACWHDNWGDANIIAYRLHKAEVKPELCESVTRSIPDQEEIFSESASIPRINQCRCSVVDVKPTIEQLAQDYRKKLDFANRKQLEAEDARVAADAALGELERAGEAIGLVIGVAKPNPVIADWRDLMERDVIWFGGDDEQAAGEYSVLEVEHADYGGNRAIRIDTVGNDYWIDVTDDWKFIRRP